MDGDTANVRQRRKQLRAEALSEYKLLTKDLKDIRRNDDPVTIQKIISSHLDKSTELYSLVKRKLEGTSADSKHLRELVNLCQEASKRINVKAKPFELRTIIYGLRKEANDEAKKKLGTQEFARYITENHVNTFLRNPPTFEFFYGALRNEGIVVKDRKRKIREKFADSQAITSKEKNIEVDVEQDSTPKEVEHIEKQLVRLSKNKQRGISFFETIVDPKSFIQTVENIFHVSFLVKDGKVGVRSDDERKAVLTVEGSASNQSQEMEHASTREGAQSILSFSMDDYKQWISTHNIRKRAFEPRNDTANNEDD